MKFCNKCNQEKKENDFGRDRYKKDGLNTYCKTCIRIRSEKKRKENLEYHKEYAGKYRDKNRENLRKKSNKRYWENREKRLNRDKELYLINKEKISKRRKILRSTEEARKKEAERQKKWRLNNKKKYTKYIKKWQQTNRIKHNAHQRVHRAIKNGILIRDKYCEECKMKCKTEGHHEDYTKPLVVKWLCRRCHGKKIETIEV